MAQTKQVQLLDEIQTELGPIKVNDMENHPFRGYLFSTGGAACRGCGSAQMTRLLLDNVYQIKPEAIVIGAGCGVQYLMGPGGYGSMEGAYMTIALGVAEGLRYRGQADRLPMVVISGDGQLLEESIDHTLGAFHQQAPVAMFIANNEGFRSPGHHGGQSTLPGSKESVALKGWEYDPRETPMMFMYCGAKYAATASPAYPFDFQKKVAKALANTPSIVDMYAPSVPDWGIEPKDMIEVCRLAVQTGLRPLYEWDATQQQFRRTVKGGRERKPVTEFTRLQLRFEGISEELMDQLQNFADTMDNRVEGLSKAFPGKGK